MIVSSAQWTDSSHTVFNAIISSDEFKNLPYTVCLNSNDTAPMHVQLVEMYKNNLIEIKEYDKLKLISEWCDSIRSKRNLLLLNTDRLLTIPDFPISESEKEEVRSYRQLLRDITKQEGFPENVIWPDQPECVKKYV